MDDLSAQGIEHFNAGRFDEALRCFRGAGGPEAGVFAAHVLDASGRAAEAAAEFASVIGRTPGHLPAYKGLAGLILRRGPLPGVEALRGALAMKDVETLRLCAQAWRAVGDLDSAEKALAGDASRLVEILYERAQSRLSADDPEKAETELRRILVLEPKHAQARRSLSGLLRRRGQALVSSGRLDRARTALKLSLRADPGDEETRAQLAVVAAMREQEERARRKAASHASAQKLRLRRRRAERAAERARERQARARRALSRSSSRPDGSKPRPRRCARLRPDDASRKSTPCSRSSATSRATRPARAERRAQASRAASSPSSR
jgi:tetratricopeptide (TPR) repeat protein